MSLASGLPTPIRKLLAEAELVLEAPFARRIFTNRDSYVVCLDNPFDEVA